MKISIIEEAVSLPVEQRAELVDILMQSLNQPSEKNIDRAWIKEAERRYREIKKGTVRTVPADRIFDEIHERLSK